MRLLTLSLILLSYPLLAQATLTSPAGLDSKDASSMALSIGAYATLRNQFLDGEIRSPAMSISQIDLRLDRQFHVGTPAARQWPVVVLTVGTGNADKHSAKLDQNFSGTPLVVFLGKVTWPALTKTPVKTAPWGGSKGAYTFPFRKPFAKAKDTDLIVDFDFRNGTMPGKKSWAISTYAIDGVHEYAYARATATFWGSNSCRDSGQARAAMTEPTLLTWRKNIPDTRRRDTTELRVTSWFAAKSAPIVQAIGTGQSGQNIGACQPLFLPQPTLLFFGKTNADGTRGLVVGIVKYSTALAGISLTAQAAWNDSKTGNLSLSQAGRSSVPKQLGNYTWRRSSYFSIAQSSVAFQGHENQPVFRYTYK